MEVVSTLKELLHLHPLYNEQLKMFASFGGDFQDVSRLMDMGASVTSASDAQLQDVLQELSIPKRCACRPAPSCIEGNCSEFCAALSPMCYRTTVAMVLAACASAAPQCPAPNCGGAGCCSNVPCYFPPPRK